MFCLLSSFLLFSTRCAKYLMAFWCMFFIRILMLDFGILRSVNLVMDCSCKVPLTLAVIVIRGFVFQPLFRIAFISRSYFACFCVRACYGNLSWQYVNSMNCTVWVGVGRRGVEVWFGVPIIQRMSGHSLAWHWHVVCGHVHSRSHFGTVCCWFVLLRFLAFVSV